MKRYGLFVVLLMIGTVYGVTTFTLQVPDQHISRVIAAFEAQADSHITITIRGSQNALDPNMPDYAASVDYRVESDPNESQNAYAKRFIKSAIKAFVEAHEQKLLEDVKAVYDSNSPATDPNVPDDIVQ